MQRITSLLAALTVIVLSAVSCLNEKEGTYSFGKYLESDADSTSIKAMLNVIKANPYFCQKSTYTGTYSDVFVKAQNEFVTEVGTIKDTSITKYLEDEEYAALILKSEETTEVLAYKLWAADDDD